MPKKELMGYPLEEVLQTLEPPARHIIKKHLDDLRSSMEEKEGFSDLSILLGIWNYVNFILIGIDKESPNSDLQKLMNDINNYHSFVLNNQDFIKNDLKIKE